MTPELQKIIGTVYSEFAAYKIKLPLEVCDCCVTPEEKKSLINTPLRQIPSALLMQYNNSAKISHPAPAEFKYYFPRFLDLTAQFDYPSHSPELIFCRMGLAGDDEWKVNEWDEKERQLFEEFATHFFRQCLAVFPLHKSDGIDSVLLMLGLTGYDISALLNEWEISNDESGTIHFADFIIWHLDDSKKRMKNSFKTDVLSERIIQWVFSEKTKKIFANKIETILMSDKTFDQSVINSLNWSYDLLR